jgi:hypothetical protein
MSFACFSSVCAYLAAFAGLGYSIVFVATTDDDTRFGEGLEGALLLLGGMLAVAVAAGLYEHVRERNSGFALLGAGGGLGAAIHGAYELAVAVENAAAPELPSAIDPRGFLAFGVTGAAVALFASLLEARSASCSHSCSPSFGSDGSLVATRTTRPCSFRRLLRAFVGSSWRASDRSLSPPRHSAVAICERCVQ